MPEFHFQTPLNEAQVRQLSVGDSVYLDGIVELARFYMATLGPQAAAHAATVREAGGALTRFDEAAF